MDPSISRFIFAQNIVFFVANRCVYISFMETLHICLTYYRNFSSFSCWAGGSKMLGVRAEFVCLHLLYQFWIKN